MSTVYVTPKQNHHMYNCIYKKGVKYEATRIEGPSDKYYVKHDEKGDKCHTIPGQYLYIVNNTSSNDKDVWTYITDKTGVDRFVVKQFFFKMFSGESTIPELSREFKLSAFKIQHLILCWDDWAGVSDED